MYEIKMPTSLKWTVASRGPDVSNWMLDTQAVSTGTPESNCSSLTFVSLASSYRGHAKCVRSRWSTSLKWNMASMGPDVSNWMLDT